MFPFMKFRFSVTDIDNAVDHSKIRLPFIRPVQRMGRIK